jgi:3,4-dihydroxy 2-butanone 4-phosphate synthase/GTP cyclohydrolase II
MIPDETGITPVATSTIPIKNHGHFIMTVFSSPLNDAEHFALVKSPTVPNQVPLVRVHSECITGDVFGSSKCDCGAQLDQSLTLIGEQGGVIIYLRQEGRGIGLANKLKAYALQEKGFDTVEANLELGLPVDSRDYAVACQILKYLGIDVLRLLTNNPNKVKALEQNGLQISERVALLVEPTPENRNYLSAKQKKLGHYLTIN